jgi:uncharacterized protein (UPF0548 family)
VDLQTIAQLPFTYPEVGATAGPFPPGYKHMGYAAHIGMGQLRFEEAADAVMHWGMQRGSGLRVEPSSESIAAGAVVLDEPHVRGFAYGTLPGHPEIGEERFVVRHDPVTSAVFAEVSAFSRPATWWAKAGGPFTSLIQRVMNKRYVRAV